MEREPIRIRLTPRHSSRDTLNPRVAFWQAVRQGDAEDGEIGFNEGKLCREFGNELRQVLLRHISEPLRTVEKDLFRGEFRDLERFLFRFFDGPISEKSWDRAQVLDAFTRLLDQRQRFFRESPGLNRLQERIAAAANIVFTTRIAGYSSLNLDLSVGSLKSVAEAFDNDFDSFRVFLEAFVPQAFDHVFSSDYADRLDFSVQVPSSYEAAFHASVALPQTPQAVMAVAPAVQPVPATTPAREKAEWLWRLANGSLLVPLLLALAVMYQGMSMLKEIRGTQYEALKPVLDHQLKLLEEDRRRLFKEPPQAPVQAASK